MHVSIFSFSFVCLYPSLLNSPPLSLKKCLGGPKYDIHIENMLWIISSLLLVLISLAAEYLVDVCRIQYCLCPCSFKSRDTVSLNLFPRVNPTTGLRGYFLNLRQTEQESQTSQIRSRNSLSLKALLLLIKDINFSAFLLFSTLKYFLKPHSVAQHLPVFQPPKAYYSVEDYVLTSYFVTLYICLKAVIF